ncbi:hypothetical protein [Plantactinospora sp. DSM 117369]
MILSFFASQGWESWDVERRPLIPERMPVLVDNDLRFEDGPGAPRPTVAVNRWLRELPASGAPSPNSWEAYARAVKEWMEFLAEHGVGLPWTGSCAARSRPMAAATSQPWPSSPASTAPPSTAPGPTPISAEFERRLRTLQQAGDQPDPRDAQITRLKTEITGLKNRVVESTSTINELTEFQTQAPRATRRSTRRDHPSAGRRHLRQPSQPTSATGSDHRLMELTERPGRQRSGVGVRTREGVGQDTTETGNQ